MKVLSQMTHQRDVLVKLAYKQHIDLLGQEVGEYIPFTAETRMTVKFTTREVYAAH